MQSTEGNDFYMIDKLCISLVGIVIDLLVLFPFFLDYFTSFSARFCFYCTYIKGFPFYLCLFFRRPPVLKFYIPPIPHPQPSRPLIIPVIFLLVLFKRSLPSLVWGASLNFVLLADGRTSSVEEA